MALLAGGSRHDREHIASDDALARTPRLTSASSQIERFPQVVADRVVGDRKMTPQIDAMLQAGESETVEFKAQWTDAVLETATALANTRGGTLLVGVDDNGQVVGLDVAEAKLRTYSNQLADSLRIQPSLQVLSLIHISEPTRPY